MKCIYYNRHFFHAYLSHMSSVEINLACYFSTPQDNRLYDLVRFNSEVTMKKQNDWLSVKKNLGIEIVTKCIMITNQSHRSFTQK
jgi:hypothetical protein